MCDFCNENHKTEDHLCLFCGLRGLHSFKNCYLKCLGCKKKLEIIVGVPICSYCDKF